MRDAGTRFAESAQRAGASRTLRGGSGGRAYSPSSSDGSSAPTGLRAAARLGLIGVLATLVAAALAAPSFAAEHVEITGEYGKEGPKAGGLGNGCRIGWHAGTERLYLLSDSKIYRLERTAPGSVTPLASIEHGQSSTCGDRDLGVDNSGAGSNGNLYFVPSGNGNIYGYDSTGAELGFPWPVDGGTGETCGVAPDNEGNVWGGHYSGDELTKFSSSGTLLNSYPFGDSSTEVCKLEVDQTTNDVFGQEYGDGQGIWKFTPPAYDSEEKEEIVPDTNNSNSGLAINGEENKIYVANGTDTVTAYDTDTGAVVETITPPGGSTVDVDDVAVDEGTDTLFLVVDPTTSNQFNDAYIVEYLGVKTPKATTLDPIGNTEVAGIANPNEVGPITECFFEFGATLAYGEQQPCAEGLPINAEQEVTADLPGLLGETPYNYRLVVGNGEYQGRGGNKIIEPHYVQNISTEAASEVMRTSAQLNGSFEGNGEETTYFFEYGTTDSYGSRMPMEPTEENAGSPGSGTVPMSVTVSGLTPETTYHFRVVGKNPQGTSPAQDETFETPLAVENVTTEEAGDQTRTTAVLNGSFTGNGEPHTYTFEWGPTASYGNEVSGNAGEGVGKVDVASTIEGLEPYLPDSEPYHYRLIATNSTGSSIGEDHTFYPAPPGLPQISGLQAEEVSATGARLSGTVNPEEGPTIYSFEYGQTSGYGSITPASAPIGEDTSDHPVSELIAGLEPGTIYHFRLVAINFGGTTHSADETFVTPGPPKIESSAASAVTSSTANLSAQVVPTGSLTVLSFEYGTTPAYGGGTGPILVGADFFAHQGATVVGGLVPGTTYHFRAVATNGVGEVRSANGTFTTLPAPTVAPKNDNRCKGLARRAKKNSNRAKRLRRKASKSSNGRRTRQLRRNARKAAKQARRLSRRAKACRRSSGGNG